MKWNVAPIEDLKASTANALVGGPFGSNLTTRDYVDDGVPVIRGANLNNGAMFSEDEFVFVSEEKADELSANIAHKGDLLFTQRGTLGQVGLIPPTAAYDRYVVSQSQMKLTVDPAKTDARFIYFYFRHPLTVQSIRNRAITSGVPHINLGILREFPVPHPPLPVQTRIADVLSSYDDLLENNARRIKLLEESARLLYEEWFVRLRFPGHEHTPIHNGLPKGWQRVPTPEAIDINPRTKLSDEDEHWWVQMGDLPLNSMVIQNAIKRSGRSGSKFMNGDTLLARITPCLENGKTAFVAFMQPGEVGRGSTEFIVLRSRTLTPEYVYCLARTYAFRHNAIKSMIGASGRQRVQESCFEKFLVYVPPKTLLDAFTDFARPVFRQIQTLHMQNQKLQQALELLLPRLMNGEIAV